MLHAKFQDHRSCGSGEVFTIYGHDGHLGHVTWTVYIPLRIETGRFVGEKPLERLCRLCDKYTPEDEEHFLLDCTFYTFLREQCFEDIIQRISEISWMQMNNSEKMKLLICTYPRQTAKYLVNAFLKRRKTFYKT